MPNFLSLPPSDFEALAADVLSTAFGVRFERFGEGCDGGIDCQYEHIEGSQRELWVGQAKRYSDVSALLRQMPEEQAKMQSLTKQPKRYFLVAACALLPQHKEQIKSAMQPYILSTGDIWGADDIEALFKAQPRLYARHHRLWLHSFGQLQQHLNAASFARSEAALAELYDRITCFVEHPQVGEIETQLAEHQACFIVGDPGSGKTTTAAEIAFRHCLTVKDTEPYWFGDRSFGEALQLIRPGTKQLFVFDDCFGATFISDFKPNMV